MIVHIAPRARWEEARASGTYRAQSLTSQGFIHCSKPQQVVAVANAVYRGQRDLVLLCIDEAKLHAPVRYEPAGSGELFPHLYGPLNAGAIVRVIPIEPGPDGGFTLPAELREQVREP